MVSAQAALHGASSRLETAETPAAWYTDPAVLALEREKIFKRTWQFAGYLEDLAAAGDFITTRIGGTVPVAVVRGRDGDLHGVVNVCRHRGAQVLNGCGTTRTIRCPYHAWQYDLDGSFLSAPRVTSEGDFNRESLGLLPVAVDVWGPLVFVNVDADAAPLAQTLHPISSALDALGIDFSRLRRSGSTEFRIRANWKIVAENYLECYHCPVVHPAFSRTVDIGADSYLLRHDDHALMAHAPVRDAVRCGEMSAPYNLEGRVSELHCYLLFPTMAFNVLPGGSNLQLYSWAPISPTDTTGAFEYLLGDDVDPETANDLKDWMDVVGREDVPLVESVQRGMDSGAVPHGHLVLPSEDLVQSFQRLVAEAIA